MSALRLRQASAVNTGKVVNFTFDGRAYRGCVGDTLASALLANDVAIVGRSFKRHRPRGIVAAGLEECNALVTVGNGGLRSVSLRATEVALTEGLSARSQNAWPDVRFDVAAINDWLSALLPAGFYHKTFKWPHWHWFEWAVRHAAGLGTVGVDEDAERYSKRFAHTDVLVIGAGPAGIRAAVTAAQRGDEVILLDGEPRPGGSLWWRSEAIDGAAVDEFLQRQLNELSAVTTIRVLTRTLATGYYDDDMVTAVEQCDGEAVAQRLWKIRAASVVLATGAYERPMVFPGNDRPGVMLLDAAARYALQYGVAGSASEVVYCNNDAAWRRAIALRRAGVAITAIIDVRNNVDALLLAAARGEGIVVYAGYAVIHTSGRRRLNRITIGALNAGGQFADGPSLHLAATRLLMAGGWNPVVHLYSQAGGQLRFDSKQLCFVPDGCLQNVSVVGAANGDFATEEGQLQGPGLGAIAAWWQTPVHRGRDRSNQQWVDFLHDVTVADIALAARENFRSVEHLKRYTATGMAVDQGKTSNINALAIMGQLTDRDIPEVGTTRFRPPFHPIRIGTLAGETVGRLAQRYRRLPVQWHAENGAVFEDHSGWLRPAYYLRPGETEASAIRREVLAARRSAALFDSSSLGKIEIQGPDAAEFLNRIYINNVKTLKPGKLRYGMMLNENGVIIDDGVFGCIAVDHYFITTSSAGALDIPFWMEEWLQTEWRELEVWITPQTAQWATLTLSGPQSRAILKQLLVDEDLSSAAFPHMSFRVLAIDEIPLRLCRVSFTGEMSWELNVPATHADRIWRKLYALGAGAGIVSLGMEALDALRIEKGFLEVGVDTDGDTTPLDVGWGGAIAKKPDDFLGRRSLAREHSLKARRAALVGFQAPDIDEAIGVGSQIVNADGVSQGHITSSVFSPTLDRSVGMALLEGGMDRLGERLAVAVAGRLTAIEVTGAAHLDSKGERMHV